MSTLTKAQRDKLPESDFGDAKARLFPIVDQDDVDSAKSLIGKASDPDAVKARIKAIAKRKGLKIPDAWQDDAKHSATFAGDATEDGDYVLRTGKVFECGAYEDKSFSLTPEEALDAVADFRPVPLDLGHGTLAAHPLEGKMGELRSVALGEDGWSLVGTVALPKWLDAALGDVERKVSATWDRATKRLTGLAIVTNPRVPDAAIFDAYATFSVRHDTDRGQMAMQDLHDTATRYGAVCKPGASARMASAHEAQAIQQMHDTAAEHGARCDDRAAREMPYPIPMFTLPGRRATTRAKETTMGFFDKLTAALRLVPEEQLEAAFAGEELPDPKPAAAAAAAESDELKKARDEAAKFAEENRKLRAEGIRKDAVAFAEKAIAESKAFPAEKEALISLYTQAATDDIAHGAVTFAEGQTTSRVALLEAQVAARPDHKLTTAIGSDGKTIAVPNQGTSSFSTDGADGEKKDPKRVEALLASTELGQGVLRERQNGASRN